MGQREKPNCNAAVTKPWPTPLEALEYISSDRCLSLAQNDQALSENYKGNLNYIGGEKA